MADVKISALAAATAPDGTETLPVVQGATTKKATVTQVLAPHVDDTTDAHDASAIFVVPAGGIAATTVQAALAELDAEKLSTVAASGTYAPLGGGLPSNVVSRALAYTAAVNDFVLCDTTSAGFIVTLPTAPATGALVAVKKTSADANTLTIAPAAGGTTDGDATTTTTVRNAGAVFEHVGSNAWRISAVTSAQGPTGATGATGLTGPQGNVGPAGPAAGQVGYGVALTAGRFGYIGSAQFGGPTAPTQAEALHYPVYFSAARTITGIGVHCWAAGSAGAVVRIGIYSSTGTDPDALLAEGTVAATSTGLIQVTFSQAVTVGTLYHIVVVSQGAPTTAPTFLMTLNNFPVFGTTVTATEVTTVTGLYSKTGVTGALPSTWGTPTRSAADARPRLFVGS